MEPMMNTLHHTLKLSGTVDLWQELEIAWERKQTTWDRVINLCEKAHDLDLNLSSCIVVK